jgi:hypothetical protein
MANRHNVTYHIQSAQDNERVLVRGVSTSGYPYIIELHGPTKLDWLKVLTNSRRKS